MNSLAVLGGGAGGLDDRFRVVAIDVKYRRLNALGDIGRVGARPGGGRRRRKTDLVVDDDVDRPAGAEADKIGQFERLGDEPLAGKGGVAMHQDAGHLAARGVAALLLLRPHLAEHDRVDRLEMRRVGGERQVHGLRADLAVARGTEMVFDVARAMDMLGIGRIALELGEDRGKRLADKIGQNVEPAAMRHADHEFPDAELAAAAQDRLEGRHQRFGALDAEPLGAGIAAVEKPLEGFGGGQAPQDFLLFVADRLGRRSRTLEFILDPGPLGRNLDVHVFDADPAAISLAQEGDDLAQGGALAAERLLMKMCRSRSASENP